MGRGFKSLEVWQLAVSLSVRVIKMTDNPVFRRDFGLVDQIRRSAVSLPSNIAEGDERGSDREAVRFFYIAKASLAELQTQLIISSETGRISLHDLEELEDECRLIGAKLGRLIKCRSSKT